MKEDQTPGRQLQREVEQLRQRVAELEQAANKQEQTEEELRESEKQYRDLVENLNEVIYTVNESGVVTYVSPAIESLIEYTPPEVVGSHFGKHVHQDDLPRLKESFTSILSGVVAENEYRVLAKSGEIRWVRTSSRPTYEGNRVVGVHGVLSNITKWKQTEEALARRADQLQLIGEVTRKASSFLDPDSLLSYVATAIQQHFGYYHVDVFLVDKTQEYAVFETSSSPSVAARRKDKRQRFKVGKEGMIGWVANTGEPLLANDVSREPRYLPDKLLPNIRSELVVPLKVEDQIMGVLDIDSDKLEAFDEEDIFVLQTLATQLAIALGNARLYEETRQLAAFNEGIVENAVVGISVEDADGNLTFLNPAAADLLGYPIEELIGQHWTTVVAPDQQAIVQETLKQRLVGLSSSYELEIVRKDGRRRSVLVSGSPRFENGRFAGVQTIFTDLTLQKQAEKALRVQKDKFEGMVASLGDGLDVVSQDYRVHFQNKVLGDRFGDLTGKLCYEEYMGRETPCEPCPMVKAIATGNTQRVELTGVDGRKYELTSTPFQDIDGETKVIEVVRDITKHKQAEEQVRQLSQFQESIIDNANVWLDVLDVNHNVLIWNKAAEAISGYSKEEVVGRAKIWEWLYPEDAYRKALAEKVAAVVEKGETREGLETTIHCKNNQTKVISWHEQRLVDEKGDPIGSIALGRDITERKRVEEQLAYMATHDTLTGLPNRQAFSERLDLELEHAYRNQRQLAVMMLDLDHFKEVNDTLGHSMGDKLLQAVGKRLTSLRRKSDTVARFGGDEFMLILPEITQYEDAERIAQELLEAVRDPLAVDGHALRISTSIGVVLYPEDADNAETLVRKADIAMYRAKEMGRNTCQRYAPS